MKWQDIQENREEALIRAGQASKKRPYTKGLFVDRHRRTEATALQIAAGLAAQDTHYPSAMDGVKG